MRAAINSANTTTQRKATRTRIIMERLISIRVYLNFKGRSRTLFQALIFYFSGYFALLAGVHQLSFDGGEIRTQVLYFCPGLVDGVYSLFGVVGISDVNKPKDENKKDTGKMTDRKTVFKIFLELQTALQLRKKPLAFSGRSFLFFLNCSKCIFCHFYVLFLLNF